ncbi:hypothetical protein [Haloferula sp. BvORR071]|uniref:hypothetical protein n=1 Tax=Haloferula sp. BvORR071 TaxID=1396141 RepID=UPI0005552021|nr:hypothetical protein [Haloferula sp. BvORR071]
MQLAHEIDGLLLPLAPVLAKEADAILDLRELLMSKGHPGKCVRCFFQLFTAASSIGNRSVLPHLAPLIAWMETNLEIGVRADGIELETMPVKLRANDDLESFCIRSIENVRFDRGFTARRVDLAFRYKNAEMAAA